VPAVLAAPVPVAGDRRVRAHSIPRPAAGPGPL